jgi:hypothetical protein
MAAVVVDRDRDGDGGDGDSGDVDSGDRDSGDGDDEKQWE